MTAAALRQAAALHQAGDLDGARALYEKIAGQYPDTFEAIHALGTIAYQHQDYAKAADLIGRALVYLPDNAAAHANLGLTMLALHQTSRAVECYVTAIVLQPGDAPAHFGLGLARQSQGDFAAAIASYDQAVRINPGYAEAWSNRGNALQALERAEDAIASYDRALAAVPGMASAHYNRAVALHGLGLLQEALLGYDRAIALHPGYADAWSNRGIALKGLWRLSESLESFMAAVQLDPTQVDAKRNIFWHHLAELKDTAQAEQSCAELLSLAIEQDAASLTAAGVLSPFRARHDLEQIRHQLAAGYATDELRSAALFFEGICERAMGAGQGIVLSADEMAAIARHRSRPVLYQPTKVPGPCLNPENDWTSIEEQYLGAAPEIVVIDDLLSPWALSELQQYCLTSAVWTKEYPNQYLGAFADRGFFSPLHAQIAVELRSRMPRIFADHPLEQLWGFKYAAAVSNPIARGIGVHADFARVNLNFWISPDDANLDPRTGGLIVYDVPSPSSWSFREYNNNAARIREFLEARKSGYRQIPYKCNRAALFNSNLFHETDAIRFQDGYENRRINITYLFGRGLRAI